MPKYQTEILFPYSVEQIHNMVADIEKYPEFVPNCSSLWIKNSQKSDKKRHFLAEMGVKFSIFSEKFDSNVEIDDMFHSINVTVSSGPIKKLNLEWKFLEQGENCKALFSIDMEMKALPMKLALAAAFKISVIEMTDAFITRSNELYKS
ncbi:MAG: hypothetical protein OCD03_03020 [Hyphomicrobiales bacterium]